MEDNFTWKSYIYDLPRGTQKFILNASINTLPTLCNLKQWGKCPSEKCPHCGSKETTFHILNGCKKYLEDGRFTWRHDNIINYIYSIASNHPHLQVYADIPLKTVPSGGTIPADIIVTSAKPDLVVVSREERELHIYELTVPYETRLEFAHDLKAEKYAPLVQDLQDRGWKTKYFPIEVGSRGLMPHRTKVALYKLLQLANHKKPPKSIYQAVSKLAVVGSYKIYLSRKETTWTSPAYLCP